MILPVIREHLPVLCLVVGGRKVVIVKIKSEIEPFRGRFQNANALRRRLLPDPVARDDGNLQAIL